MRNEKGLTLIEILGSIVLIGIVVLGVGFILQQSALNTKHNEKVNLSVQISRNAMEELRANLLSANAEVSLYGQSVQLAKLPTTIYYPSASEQRYRIHIQSLASSLPPHVQVDDVDYDLETRFRRIQLTCTDLSTNKDYALESYLSIR